MKRENNFASYFDDVPEEKNEAVSELKENLIENKTQLKKEDFERPFPPIKKNSNQKCISDKTDQLLSNLIPYEGKDNVIMEGDEEYEILGYQELDVLADQMLPMPMGEEMSSAEEIPLLEEELKSNPQHYDLMFKLIYLYRATNEKEKLRKMREYTVSLYPISDDMWKEWINDELEEIKSQHHNSLEKKMEIVFPLFQLALKDFKYLKICKKYLKFLMHCRKINPSAERDNPILSTSNMRSLFEEFVEFWGLDLNLSSKLFELYLKFEIDNLKNDPTDKTVLNNIRSIWRRRLSFPHIDLDLIWNQYQKEECSKEEMEKMEQKYKQSSKKMNDFINFEEIFNSLLDATRLENDSSKLCVFLKKELPSIALKYINYYRLYFEKSLELNCDDEKIWEMYLEVIGKFTNSQELCYSLLTRAVKCCFDQVTFWIYLLREMESIGRSSEEIQEKIRQAYAANGEDPDFRSEIWKYTLEYCCRSFDASVEQLQNIRTTFANGIKDVEENGNDEYLPKLYRIWCEFEVYKVKDKIKMEELMDRVVKVDSSAENWEEYVAYEKYFGDEVSIRKIYKRAVEYCKEDNQSLSDNWICWEKMFGRVKDIKNALSFTKLKLSTKKDKKLKKKRKVSNEDDDNEEQIDAKEELSDIEETFTKTIETRVILKNIPSEINEDNLSSFIKDLDPFANISDVRIVRDRMGISRGFAFIDFKTSSDAQNAVALLNGKDINGNILSCALSRPPSSGENDNRTVFVNNIPFSANEDLIHEIFSEFGNVLDVRIIYDSKTHKPKGYCYVEYSDESSVDKVLSEKEILINNRKAIIKKSQSVAKLRENLKHVAHVSNLPFKTKENDLKDFFIQFGLDGEAIIEVLLVRDDNNNPKGFGFVEFDSESNLNKAIALSGKMLKNRAIVIKLSKRNITSKKTDETKSKSSDTKVKDKLLNSKRNRKEEIAEDVPVETNKKPMSNKDFRKFLK